MWLNDSQTEASPMHVAATRTPAALCNWRWWGGVGWGGRETEEGDKTFGAMESLKSISTVTKVNKQTQPAATVSLPILPAARPPANPSTYPQLPPPRPPSLPLPLSVSPNRKARLLRRARYGTSPGDRYVTPPKALWHNYTSVALKGGGWEGEGR